MFFDDSNDDDEDDDDFESLLRVRYSHWKQDPIFLILTKVWRTVLLNIEIYKAKNIQSLYNWQLERGRKIKLLHKQKVKTYFLLYFDIATGAILKLLSLIQRSVNYYITLSA